MTPSRGSIRCPAFVPPPIAPRRGSGVREQRRGQALPARRVPRDGGGVGRPGEGPADVRRQHRRHGAGGGRPAVRLQPGCAVWGGGVPVGVLTLLSTSPNNLPLKKISTGNLLGDPVICLFSFEMPKTFFWCVQTTSVLISFCSPAVATFTTSA